jgi:hypothetical protein
MFPVESPTVSDPRTETNRANAAHSTGPATAAGKAVSRLNATRHGLTSQVACMTWEDRDAFNQFCASIVTDYHPETTIETQLAQAIAEDHWRLNRARAIEHNIFALGSACLREASTPPIDSDDPQIDAALAQAQTFRDEGKTFGLITLYEQRIHRNLQRNLDRLRQLQSDRRAARARALDELIELQEFKRIRGIADPPAEAGQSPAPPATGFVFSPQEIDFAVFRRRRANLLGASPKSAPKRSNRLFEDAA